LPGNSDSSKKIGESQALTIYPAMSKKSGCFPQRWNI